MRRNVEAIKVIVNEKMIRKHCKPGHCITIEPEQSQDKKKKLSLSFILIPINLIAIFKYTRILQPPFNREEKLSKL